MLRHIVQSTDHSSHTAIVRLQAGIRNFFHRDAATGLGSNQVSESAPLPPAPDGLSSLLRIRGTKAIDAHRVTAAKMLVCNQSIEEMIQVVRMCSEAFMQKLTASLARQDVVLDRFGYRSHHVSRLLL
jgi:hypothetical protein